ncbi:UBX domain-containing protein 11-like [Dendronephthya gigantea]|uniref:UBX domain-containing protein 11-like n=1 Tax=Dendronephthya gigantea TaxID=151771 RepID=UPI00106C19AE|nr:UBX domain-containing protein 11-like [Dendronephthya gigantea]
MSSPFESLKKTKKVPLNGARNLASHERSGNVPYRKTGNDPADILNHKLQELRPEKNGNGRKNMKHSQAPSDMELLSSMATRLSQSEQQLRVSTREVIEKDKKIKILEEKVKLLEKARGYGAENVKDLESKCRTLQQQVHDMEEFLADYGMIWVGSETSIDQNAENNDWAKELKSPEALATSSHPFWNPGASLPSETFEINFNLVVKNIEELNSLSGADRTVIARTKGGATLKAPDAVPLTLYANGILMFSGPFRPYTDGTTQRCIQDLMDGYFPSELQERYPDGIAIKLKDRREEVFKDKRTELLFPGSGQSLENSGDIVGHKDSNVKIHSLESINERETNVPVEKFLDRLPPSVIRNGKIIDIRSGIENTLKGSSDGSKEGLVSVIDTPVIQEIKSRTQSGGQRPQSVSYDVTTLRIKSEKGDQTYILKLKFTDTVASIRKYINKVRPELQDEYRIKTSFPNMVYDDVTQTLEEAGLVPNATLHLLVRT